MKKDYIAMFLAVVCLLVFCGLCLFFVLIQAQAAVGAVSLGHYIAQTVALFVLASIMFGLFSWFVDRL